MPAILLFIIAFIIFMHGLVHLLYNVNYWPIVNALILVLIWLAPRLDLCDYPAKPVIYSHTAH